MKENKLFEDAIKRYDIIKAMPQGSEEQSNAYDDFYDSLDGWKRSLWNKYCEAKERENDYIDFDDCPDTKSVPEFIANLQECNIEHFTISSGWSNLTERIWALCQHGCKIAGMVEINSRSKDWETGEYSKLPAFLLTIEENKE